MWIQLLQEIIKTRTASLSLSVVMIYFLELVLVTLYKILSQAHTELL